MARPSVFIPEKKEAAKHKTHKHPAKRVTRVPSQYLHVIGNPKEISHFVIVLAAFAFLKSGESVSFSPGSEWFEVLTFAFEWG